LLFNIQVSNELIITRIQYDFQVNLVKYLKKGLFILSLVQYNITYIVVKRCFRISTFKKEIIGYYHNICEKKLFSETKVHFIAFFLSA